MISHKFRCIFVHVPKTAGQSIERVFLRLHGLTWETRSPLLLRHNRDRAKGPQRLAHLKAREYVSLGYVQPQDCDQYFKFAFVRNPWDRLVSEYHYNKHLYSTITFRRFVEESLSNVDDYSDRSRHITSQVDYVTDEDGRYNVDFIGRFETLADDFAAVARKLCLGSVTLGHYNQSQEGVIVRLWRRLWSKRGPVSSSPMGPTVMNRHFQDYYNSELRDRVAEFYAEDIASFGYSFDGSFKRHRIV